MKKELQRLVFQTASVRFLVTLYKSSDGKRYVAEYEAESGTVPELAKDMASGQVRGADPDAVIAGCRAEIEKNHGRILPGK
jgi:hypothetical protein